MAAIFLWPFALLWALTAGVFELTGVPPRGKAATNTLRWAISIAVVFILVAVVGAASPESRTPAAHAQASNESSPIASLAVVASLDPNTTTPNPASTVTPEANPTDAPTPAVPSPTPRPTPPPTPDATPTPVATVTMAASNVTYTKATIVGGSIFLNATVANTGTATGEPIKFQVGGIKDYADVIGCVPVCSSTEFFGDYFLQFSDQIAPGESRTYKVEFLPKKVGVADWNVLMYAGSSKNFYAGSGSTVIR